MIKREVWWWGSAAVILGLLYSLGSILLPFLLGGIGAYAFNKTVVFLEKYRVPRAVSSAFVVLGLILLITLFLIVAVPYLQQQLFYFAVAMPATMDRFFLEIKPFLDTLSEQIGTPIDAKKQLMGHVGGALSWGAQLISNIISSSMALATIVSLVFLTPVILFYLLKDWERLVGAVDRHLPKSFQPVVRSSARRVDETLSAYARGQALVCLVLMLLYGTALWAIGLPQGFFVGILTGFLAFIPYVGMLIGMLTSLALCLTQFSTTLLWSVFIIFFVVNLIESNFISPRLIGERIGLHPVWIIFALLAGGTWLGFLGVLIALPAAAVISVVVRMLLEMYIPIVEEGK